MSERDVFDVIRRQGPAAEVWTSEFLAKVPQYLTLEALTALRKGDYGGGLDLLRTYRRVLKRSTFSWQTQPRVAMRWYLSALAFAFYRQSKCRAALSAMNACLPIVLSAVEDHPFLIPLLTVREEVALHTARIYRSVGCWEQVHASIKTLRELKNNIVPIVSLRGTDVYQRDIDSLMETTDEVQSKTDAEKRGGLSAKATLLEYTIDSVYILPDHVIPYGL